MNFFGMIPPNPRKFPRIGRFLLVVGREKGDSGGGKTLRYGIPDQFCRGLDVKEFHDPVFVVFHIFRGNSEARGDILNGAPLRQQVQHFPLPGGEVSNGNDLPVLSVLIGLDRKSVV